MVSIKTLALSGTIAHFPPWEKDEITKLAGWDALSNAVIGKQVDKPYKYTLMEPSESPFTPFYINYGVLISTPNLFSAFFEHEKLLRSRVASKVNSWWGPQLSLPLACVDAGLPTRELSMRYNFPNDPIADRMYPDELDRVVFMHYLRTEVFDRHKIFVSNEQFNYFLSLKLEGSNQVIQRHVLSITGGNYPF